MSIGEALGGALSGLGQGLVQHGQNLRDEAREKRAAELRERERSENRQWQLDDRNSANSEWDRRHRVGQDSDEQKRGDAARADANVYASLFGTESGNRFDIQNSEGYTGRSQFGDARLADYARATGRGKVDKAEFQKNPKLQKKVEKWHFSDINNFIDKNGLEKFEGQEIGGVKITRSGIIAMAHLGGLGGAKKFLESGGRYNPADSNGTSLSGYARTHGGLSTDMSGVWEAIADPNTSAAARAFAVKTMVDRASGPKGVKLSGEEWIERGDAEVLMGRDDKGTMRPYQDENGKQISRALTKGGGKLSGEEWLLIDGEEVLHGRTDDGTMKPYVDENGNPISRKPETKDRRIITGPDGVQYYEDTSEKVFPKLQGRPPERKTIKGNDGFNYYQDTGERVLPNVQAEKKETDAVSISASRERQLEKRFTDSISDEADYGVIDVVRDEIIRLMNDEDLGETEAFAKALGGMEYEQKSETRGEGGRFLGIDWNGEERSEKIGDATFTGEFKYNETGLGPAPDRAAKTPPNTPTMPTDAPTTPTGATQQAPNQRQAIKEARAAIQRGADPQAVKARLIELGIDTEDL